MNYRLEVDQRRVKNRPLTQSSDEEKEVLLTKRCILKTFTSEARSQVGQETLTGVTNQYLSGSADMELE